MPQPTEIRIPQDETHYLGPESSNHMHHALVLAQSPPMPTQTPSTAHRDGIALLHDCSNAVVDICFIHGLAGNMFDTWTASNHSDPWPKTLLPTTLPSARIFAFGYDADEIRGRPASLSRLVDISTSLLYDLVQEREDSATTARPLIFVAHSLGGLVCKEAILLSRNHPQIHLRNLFNALRGVAFMGTPHRGAWLAEAAGVPATDLGFFPSVNGDIRDVLTEQNQLLESVRLRFADMLSDLLRNEHRRIEIVCFYEEFAMGADWPPVVSKESATFDGYLCLPIHANHVNMVKFSSPADTGFRRLRNELKRWSSNPEQLDHHEQLDRPQELLLLRSLSFDSMGKRYRDIEPAVTGTCLWLHENTAYQDWTKSVLGLLGIIGKPGSGKSTLLWYAVEQHTAAADLVLSFFFHSDSSPGNTALGFLRALACQLLEKARDTATDLTEAYKNRRRQELAKPIQEWEWEENDLKEYLLVALHRVAATRSVWIFVDALDELGTGAHAVYRWLEELREQLRTKSQGSHFSCHFCVSCRHYPVLSQRSADDFRICAEDENEADIALFVKHQLSEHRLILSSDIPKLITKHALGVFKWTHWVISEIIRKGETGGSLDEMRETVRRPSNGVDTLYGRYVAIMKGNPDCLHLMQWMCFAARPLSVDELRWAMAVSPDQNHSSVKDYVDTGVVLGSSAMEQRITRLGCGLLELTASPVSGPEPAMADRTVQFVHPTAKAFMLNRGLPSLHGDSMTGEGIATAAHARLAKACLRYLALQEIGRDNACSDLYFSRYAGTHWMTHAKGCDGTTKMHACDQNDLLRLLLQPSNGDVVTWRPSRTLMAALRISPDSRLTLMHILAHGGLLGLLQTLLSKAEPNARHKVRRWSRALFHPEDESYRWPPLHLAVQGGHKDVVQLLLDHGAGVDSVDSDGITPLYLAARFGQAEMVKLLLRKGAAIDKVDQKKRTPLQAALTHEHWGVAELLVAKGADVRKANKAGDTPLLPAKRGDHGTIIQLLPTKGVL